MTPICAHCGKPALNVTAAHLRRSQRRGHRIYCGRECAALGKRIPVAERFWKYVDKRGQDECWLWTGAKNTKGYGQIHDGGPYRLILAHRLSMILHGLEVPPGGRDLSKGVIDHICKVHACVNPAHLRVVTQRVNTLENSLSPYALNAKKTHCAPGNHPFSGDNVHYTLVGDSLRRTCLACLRAKGRGRNLQPNTPETARIVPKRIKCSKSATKSNISAAPQTTTP